MGDIANSIFWSIVATIIYTLFIHKFIVQFQKWIKRSSAKFIHGMYVNTFISVIQGNHKRNRGKVTFFLLLFYAGFFYYAGSSMSREYESVKRQAENAAQKIAEAENDKKSMSPEEEMAKRKAVLNEAREEMSRVNEELAELHWKVYLIKFSLYTLAIYILVYMYPKMLLIDDMAVSLEGLTSKIHLIAGKQEIVDLFKLSLEVKNPETLRKYFVAMHKISKRYALDGVVNEFSPWILQSDESAIKSNENASAI